ncbi:hypothetical protein [Ekhidna sp.]
MERVLNLLSNRWQKLAFSFLLLLVSFSSPAQMGIGKVVGNLFSNASPQVVTDPTAHARAATTITQIKGVIGGINRQIEHLQAAANKLREVTGAVSTMQLIREIARLRQQFYDESQLCIDRLEYAKMTIDGEYYQSSLLAVYGTTRRLETDLEIIDLVLTGGLLSMEDADRISSLREIKTSIIAGIVDVRIMRRDIDKRMGYEYFKELYLSVKN